MTDLSEEELHAPAVAAGCSVHPDGRCAVRRRCRRGCRGAPDRVPARARRSGAPAGVPGAPACEGAQRLAPRALDVVDRRCRGQRPRQRGGPVRLRAHGSGTDRLRAGAHRRRPAGLGPARDRRAVAGRHHSALQRGAGRLHGSVLVNMRAPASRWWAVARRPSCRRATAPGTPGRPTAACGARPIRARRGRAIFDFMPSLSIGALAIDPADGSVWVGTGEANTSAGLLRGHRRVPGHRRRAATSTSSAAPTTRSPRARSTRSPSTPHGNAYAATNNGLFRLRGEPGPVDGGPRLRPAPTRAPRTSTT